VASVLWTTLPAFSLHAGASLNLDGTSQYGLVPANASLTPTPVTFEAWVNIGAAKCNTILSRGNGNNASTDYIFQVGYDGTTCGVMKVSLFGAGGWDSSASLVPLHTWTHVAATYDGTNKQFYINGVLDHTNNRAGSLYLSGSAMYLGRQGVNCDCNFFQGQLAEVRIWNTIRTAAEIVSDMNISSGPQPGLVAYYHLNEGTGTNANDASGNGNTATIENGAGWSNSVPPFPVPAVLGLTTRVEGPAAGTDSVVLSNSLAWTATTNAAWLHLSVANQSGLGSTNVIFTFDANPGATRVGALTIAGQTLAITQAGSNYVAASPFTVLTSAATHNPPGVAVDAAGNVYIADGQIKKWLLASNDVITLTAFSWLGTPTALAVDGAGNVYVADEYGNEIWEYTAANSNLTILVLPDDLDEPVQVALDGATNVYIADSVGSAIKEWSPVTRTLTTVVATGNNIFPQGVALDAAGNLYFSEAGNTGAVQEWSAASRNVNPVFTSGVNGLLGLAVDGAGNIYVADYANGAVEQWSAANHSVTPFWSLPDGTPDSVAVDGAGNVYIGAYSNQANVIGEVPRAFVDPTPVTESAAAGSGVLPPVLPATQNLLPPFAPASDQAWLTITGVTNGPAGVAGQLILRWDSQARGQRRGQTSDFAFGPEREVIAAAGCKKFVN